ncbi:MAG: alpha/beta hydrolase family protein [Solirubrobacterales bacterium]
MSKLEVETPHGAARVQLDATKGATHALVLGHGAGGGVEAPDLVAARDVALAEGLTVALVEQPYRVAGRRSPAPAKQLDAAWIAVLERLRERELSGLEPIVGGRSLGARVACRTLEKTGGAAVLCLAFPLQPPARKGKARPPSRVEELEAVSVPMLIVQGESDQFGMPEPAPAREVAKVPGNHSLRKDPEAVAAAVRDWLPRVAGQATAA